MNWVQRLKQAFGRKLQIPQSANHRATIVAEPLPPEVQKRLLHRIRRSLHTLDVTRHND